MKPILTIGHSNHPLPDFLEMLARANVTAVADIRSQPVSRWAPQFSKEALISTLEGVGLPYLFMGRELGGRPREESLLTNGKPDYAKMSRTSSFKDGIKALLKESAEHRMAVMCAERDPLNCHRFLLVGRHLAARGIEVAHILADGSIESHTDGELRLMGREPQADLFRKA